MLLFNQSKLYAPDMETGADIGGQDDGASTRVPLNEAPSDGPGSGRGKLRQQLESSVATERKGREEPVVEKGPKETKRQAKAKGPNHQEVVEEPEAGTEGAVVTEGQEAVVGEAGAEGVDEDQDKGPAPPQRLSKEAKEAWAQTPEPVKAAFLKFEEDVSKGVTALKQRYSSIDEVLAPRMEVIRSHGHSPAQAINQLFAWFEALSGNPKQAFPALAQSFKFDLSTLLGGQAAQQGQQEQKGQKGQEAPEVDPAIKAMLDGVVGSLRNEFSTQLGGLTTSFQQQNMAKTQDILTSWSKDKPYFEDVRKYMAHLIGTGMVPPRADGSSDLDTAYDQAIYALAPVRAKVLADQQKAAQAAAKIKQDKEKALQQQQADKARRAGGASLQSGSPGSPVTPGAKKGNGKSVRESLMEAREEVTSR